jgi:hypothetical protein
LVPLLIQILAVVAVAALVLVVLERLGVAVGIPQAAAVAVLAVLASSGVINMREQWKHLDLQRAQNAGIPAQEGRGVCRAVGVDAEFLGYVGSRVPVRERFYLDASPQFFGSKDICMRFVLLPRTQVAQLKDARYVVFWDPSSRQTMRAVRQRGATIAFHDRRHAVARLP